MPTTVSRKSSAGASPFREQTLYYRYEPGTRKRRPTISTWLYLGRQVLGDETAGDSLDGYVFVLVPVSRNQPAWNITQTIWSLGDARKTMRPWTDFARFILTWRECCCSSDSCKKDGTLGRVLSAVTGGSENSPATGAGESDGGGSDGGERLREGETYYTVVRPPDLPDSWPAVCGTYICAKGPDHLDWTLNEQMDDDEWAVVMQELFSRGLAPEQYGLPFTLKGGGHPSCARLTGWDGYRHQILRALGLPSGREGAAAQADFTHCWESLAREEQDMLAGYLTGLDDDADLVEEFTKYLEYLLETRDG